MSAYLTPAEKVAVFKRATAGLPRHLPEGPDRFMSDQELEAALKLTLGIMGGGTGPGDLAISYKGAGLKIWVGWDIRRKALYQGAATIKMARSVYGIREPGDTQLSLF